MKKNMQKRLAIITLTFIFAVVVCGTVSAADVYVNDTGNDGSGDGSITNPYKTINWGITNSNPDDTINLNAATFNTYTDNTHKDYNITINKNLNIKGAGQDQTIIDAGGKGWIFTVQSGYTVTISNLTITNGKASDGTTGNPGTNGGNGGAIINSGTLTLNNVSITNSRAGNGGSGNNGVSGSNSGKNGGNGGNGGAIYNTGTLTLNSCILSGNRAGNGGNGGNARRVIVYLANGGNGGTGGNGGGIYNTGTLLISNSALSSNNAGNGGSGGNGLINGNNGVNGDGGAIYNNANLNMNNGQIYSNQANNHGSGIYTTGTGTVTIANGIIRNNVNGDGIGIYVNSGNPTITGNQIYSNTQQGIYANSGSSNITGNQIYSNGNAGIYINGGFSSISGNNITYNTQQGIYINNGNPVITGNNIRNNANDGIHVENYSGDSTHPLQIHYNSIVNNGVYGLHVGYILGGIYVNATYNWWGTNSPSYDRHLMSSPPAGTNIFENFPDTQPGRVTYDPYLYLTITADTPIYNGGDSNVHASLTTDNHGNPAPGTVPDGTLVNFSFQGTPLGTLDINPVYTNNGQATTTFTANTVGTSHVMATVDSQTVGPADIQIDPMAELNISKSVDNVSHPGQTINYQDNINYTITVNNIGLDPAENVVITDTISDLLNFDPASVTSNVAFTYSWDSVNRIFTAYLTNPLNVGDTAYLYLPAQVLAHNQNVDNTANVTTTTYDPATPDEANLSFYIPTAADVVVTKEFQDIYGNPITNADYNQTVVTVITVKNNGPDGAYNVILRDLLPAELQIRDFGAYPNDCVVSIDNGLTWRNYWGNFVYHSGNSFWWYINREFQWPGNVPLPVVGPNGENTCIFKLFATNMGHGNALISNNGGVNPGELWQHDQNTTNNYASDSYTANAASDIMVTKQWEDTGGNSIDHADYNQTVVSDITVTNDGPDAANGVVLTDTLPVDFIPDFSNSLIYYSDAGYWEPLYDCTHWNYDAATRLFTWYVTDHIYGNYGHYMLNGTSDMVKIFGTNVGHGDQTVSNTAGVDPATLSQYDWNTTNNYATDSYTANAAANVDLWKEFRQTRNGSSIDKADYHDTVWAVIRAHNKGPDAATVTITDTSSGFKSNNYFVSYDNGAHWVQDGSYDLGTGIWTINMPVNATYLLAIRGVINQTGTVTNTAEQTAQNITHTEPFETATATLSVDPAANINLASMFRANYNGPNITTANYHDYVWAVIRAHNAGPDSANVIITDVPSGFTPNGTYRVNYNDGTGWHPNDGSFDLFTGEWTINMPANATYLLAIYGQVTATGIVNHTANQTAQDIYSWGQFESKTANLTVPRAAAFTITKYFTSIEPWSWPAHVNSANYLGYVWSVVQVTNNGPDASNITIQDVLHGLTQATYDYYGIPFQYVVSDGFGWYYPDGSYNPTTGIWNSSNSMWGALTPGATRLFAIYTQVTATTTGLGGPVYNEAQETSQSAYQYTPNAYGRADLQVNPAADLSVSKDVDDNTPDIGQMIMYTIRAYNNLFSPNDATGVTVTDDLPEGVTFSSASSPDYDPNTDTWNVGSLLRGEEKILYIWAIVNAHPTSPSYTNTATINGNQYDWNPSNNQDSETIYEPVADIQLTKTTSNSAPNVGQQFTYTITATNGGPQTATNVYVSDLINSGLTINSVSFTGSGSQSYDWGTGVWWIGSILSGQNAQLIITVTPTSSVAGTDVINTATKTAEDQYDPTTPDVASVTVHVPRVNITLQKSVDVTTQNVGQNVIYTLTASNAAGADNATNVRINDLLPAGLTFVSADGNYDSITGEWLIGTLNAGTSAVLHITATVTSALGGQTVNNNATYVYADQYDTNAGYVTPEVNFYVPEAASVNLHKEFRDTPWGNVLTTADYHNTIWAMVEATNIGPNATSVTIGDILTGINWTGNYRVYMAGNPNDPNNWILNDPANPFNGTSWSTYLGLLGGNTKWLAIECIINQTGSVSNFANVTSQSAYAYNGYANATASLAVPPASSVYITTSAAPTNLTVGGTTVITVKVGNNGPDAASNVIVAYTVPSGFEFVSVTQQAGYPAPQYNAATRTVTWNLGTLDVIDPDMYITLRGISPGIFDNIANVTTTTYDPNTGNKTSSVTVNVQQPVVPNVNAASSTRTIGMQETGLPLAGLVLAILAVFGGLVMPKRKN